MDKLKQTKKLFKRLFKDEKSVFYGVDKISILRLGKAKKLLYKKDKLFYKYYLDFEDKNLLYESKDCKKFLPSYIHSVC